jgi:hypothetical protein
MKQKLTVITDREGKVLLTRAGHGDQVDPRSGIRVGIVAGPGQHLHEIEFEIPQLSARADIEAFHDKLAEHLKKGGDGRKKS